MTDFVGRAANPAWTEEDLLVEVLSLRARYDIGCCGILGIRSTDQGTFEVEYEGQDETDYVKTPTHTAMRLIPPNEGTVVRPDGTIVGELPVTFRNYLGEGGYGA